jgi:sensor c-di-GMP phosphodiesterase-like protein
MSRRERRTIWILLIALFGALLGAAGGAWLGRALVLRSALIRLSQFAADLDQNGLRYSDEINRAIQVFAGDGPGFCSSREINAMQAVVFHSLQIKDIGRIRNGYVVCSAVEGHPEHIRPLPAESILLPNGEHLYFGGYFDDPALKGIVLELNHVAILISPHEYDYWARPYQHFSVQLVNSSGQMALIGGESSPLPPSCSVEAKHFVSGGMLYAFHFNRNDRICLSVWEPATLVWSSNRIVWSGYGGLGALLGFSVCLLLGNILMSRAGLVQQLRRAIRHRDLFLVYQPIVELPSRRIVGAEALVRWQQPGGGLVSPELFVRIAEQYDLIGELTELVVDQAIDEMGALLRELPEFSISINIAASDLVSDVLYRQLSVRVKGAGFAPAQLAIELTERTTADLALTRHAIGLLHAMGHPVHIDDFGTGFSSLSYLHELSADVIKIDRVFVRTCGTDAVTASIMPQILSMARTLGLGVIVEGVETEQQARYLESIAKPPLAQGFLFGQALSGEELCKRMLPRLEKVS